MLRPSSRAAVAMVSLLAIFVATMLPPEHVHLSTPDGHAGTAHRHLNFHTESVGHQDLVAHVEAADDDDAHVVWVAISVTERPLPSAAVVSVNLGSLAPSLTITALPGGYNAVSGHDPPRKLHDPRGPPELASA